MGCKLSTCRHSSSNGQLKMSISKAGEDVSGFSPSGSTRQGCIWPGHLKVRRNKRQMDVNPKDEKVVKVANEKPAKIINLDPSGKTALKKKRMQMTLEDWIRASPSPKRENLTDSTELYVFKPFSRKVHPSIPGTESCDRLGGSDNGGTVRTGSRDNLKMEQLREIHGSSESACEYLRALDGLEDAATQLNLFFGQLMNIDGAPCPHRGENQQMIERRQKVDGREDTYTMNHRTSRRRVTFRSPKKSDIILFYSPREKDAESNTKETESDENCDCTSMRECQD